MLIPMSDIYYDIQRLKQSFVPAREDVSELVADIKKNGLYNPIIVEPYTGRGNYNYQIVSGYRRYKACEILGFKEIDCEIRGN